MNGILLFNKPILWTSHDAVDFLRRRVGQKRIGHAGALDPLATGLLILLLGESTKLTQASSALDKDYFGTMTLGVATDTQDLEGKIVETAGYENITQEKAMQVFLKFKGAQLQTPPVFSSVRKNGKRLYAWTRQGVVMEPTPREIGIWEFRLVNFCPPEIHFFLRCSKGTYVRSLCDSVGKELGCGATLSSLVRTRIGPFHLRDAATREGTEDLTPQQIESRLVKSLAEENENLSRHS